MNQEELTRCPWCLNSDLEMRYHDTEWGVPLWDDNRLFEYIVLDGFQAGLSWKIILNKRENFRKAFFGFDAKRLAEEGSKWIEIWMQDSGLVRNRMKLQALPGNARAFLEVQAEFGRFADYVWGFTDRKVIQNQLGVFDKIQSVSPEAEALSKDMKKRGFRFCGPTITYAFMQAAGLVNDHRIDCFRHSQLAGPVE